jgi:peptidase M28-like protein
MTVGATGATIHGNLRYIEKAAPTRNVVAILPGTDPKLRGEYVAVGAHSDHVGYRAAGAVDHDSLHLYNQQRWFATENPSGAPLSSDDRRAQQARIAAIHVNVDSLHALRAARRDSINNGADDDGSGSVTVLEVAEAFAKGKVKPKRSILFVWHTGEEKGLLGSRYFTDHPTVARDSIVAQINIDMVGRGAATDLRAGSESYLQLVGSRRLSTELGDLTETVNKSQAAPFTLDYTFDANGHPENIYCRSDHYNYARYGIPVVFLTTGLHGDYHQVTDEPQYIDYPHMARVGRFVLDLTTRVADLDHRPVVDKPKPDPTGACRQ